jgi:hypothetical protein
MNNKQRTNTKRFGVGETTEGELWSVFGEKH